VGSLVEPDGLSSLAEHGTLVETDGLSSGQTGKASQTIRKATLAKSKSMPLHTDFSRKSA
jgi:hypothetical protein